MVCGLFECRIVVLSRWWVVMFIGCVLMRLCYIVVVCLYFFLVKLRELLSRMVLGSVLIVLLVFWSRLCVSLRWLVWVVRIVWR